MSIFFNLLFESYWARLCTALIFSIICTTFSAYFFHNKHILRNILVYFFLSESFMGIVSEHIVGYLWPYVICQFIIFRPIMSLYTFPFFCAFIDILMVYLGCFLFQKYAKQMDEQNARLDYLIYVIIGRLAMVMGVVSPHIYLLIYLILTTIQIRHFRFQYEFIMNRNHPINLHDMIRNRIFAFLIFDMLYCIVFLSYEASSFASLIILITALFICGIVYTFVAIFDRETIRATREYDDKIAYMHQLETSQEEIIQRFSEIMESKSGETGMHVKRVSEYSAIIAEELGIHETAVRAIRIASMMHDVGKLLISNEILEKPARLTDAEFEEMKLHTVYAEKLLANSTGLIVDVARDIATQHHERWDGTGYPNNLSGNDISLAAQIVAVADVYDALTSVRSYKDAWSAEDAQREIAAEEGTHFSPEVVDAFFRGIERIENVREMYRDDTPL
ncbi:MAG: HD domain-containing protein [Lachnospiraceae bacterium]|nr:HD domain-containing protein [Lachnospiraceae bacterium]